MSRTKKRLTEEEKQELNRRKLKLEKGQIQAAHTFWKEHKNGGRNKAKRNGSSSTSHKRNKSESAKPTFGKEFQNLTLRENGSLRAENNELKLANDELTLKNAELKAKLLTLEQELAKRTVEMPIWDEGDVAHDDDVGDEAAAANDGDNASAASEDRAQPRVAPEQHACVCGKCGKLLVTFEEAAEHEAAIEEEVTKAGVAEEEVTSFQQPDALASADGGNNRRSTRTGKVPLSYRETSINAKMRRGDSYFAKTDRTKS